MPVTIRRIHDGEVDRLTVDDLDLAVTQPGYVWVDVTEPTAEEATVLSHPALQVEALAVEDMIEDLHLPKVDVYDDEILLTVHAIDLEPSAHTEVGTLELDIVFKQNLVVTFQRKALPAVASVAERLDQGVAPVDRPVALVHRILDVMMDVFVPFVDYLDRRLDLIEDDILGRPTDATRREIYGLQRDVIQLRRVVVPQAEVIRRLGREHLGLLEDADEALFRDIYDHLYRIVEQSDAYRQLLDSAMDNYRSALNDDLNRMFRVLTMLSAMLLPLTVIAGIYGMNFDHMPELRWTWAYPAVMLLMVAIVVGELIWFRAEGWIGGRHEAERAERRRELEGFEVPIIGAIVKVPAYGARAVVAGGRAVFGFGRGVGRRLTGHHDSDGSDGDGAAPPAPPERLR